MLLCCYCLYSQFLSLFLCWICICLLLDSLKCSYVLFFLFCFFCFSVFVNFSNVHWFSVKIKVSGWIERNFFSLAVFGGNLLADDVQSSVTMVRHVQSWQWIDSICLLTWGLLLASVCSLEAYPGHLPAHSRHATVTALS